VVAKVALEQGYLRVFRFPLLIINKTRFQEKNSISLEQKRPIPQTRWIASELSHGNFPSSNGPTLNSVAF
jgi:hypothetical protein